LKCVEKDRMRWYHTKKGVSEKERVIGYGKREENKPNCGQRTCQDCAEDVEFSSHSYYNVSDESE
jgi:hypothetical protein